MNRLESATKPLRLLTGVLLVALAAGCGGGGQAPILGGGGVGGGVGIANAITPGATCPAAAGATIPTVTMSDPTSGNQFVTTSTSGVAGSGKKIMATFSLAMNAATINSTTFTLAPVGGAVLTPASVGYNASTKVATLTTSSALLPNTSYNAIITVGAVTNATGTPLACSYAWTFKTAAVAGSSPVVNLGLAAPFAIAAAAGVTNTATAPFSHINGDVVLDPTATCNAVSVGAAGTFSTCAGSAPTLTGTVISPLYPDAGVTSGAIKADLLAAYNSIMAANLPGATVLGCGTIGTAGGAGAGIGCAGNATLPPGVYISATGSSIGVTGVLTLDGGGDSNAKFVFQMPSSTLTTAPGAIGVPGSTITLINGAKASNVFWQVGSSATIGTYADFKGNVLADTSITMGTSSTSCGRLLAGAVTATGLVAFDTSNVSVPGHSSAPAGCL